MSAKKSTKISKYNKGRRINAGFIIFSFIFLYIIVFVINYLCKDQISIYKVTTASIADDNTFYGLIIKDEEAVNTEAAGYITYYVSSGASVAVNDGLFSINEGAIKDQQIAENESVKIKDSNYLSIRQEIDSFVQNLDESNFSKIYDFKADLNSLIFEAKSGAAGTNMDEMISQMETNGVKVVKSPFSALVSNIVDNRTGITKDNIKSEYFDMESYEYRRINTGDLLEKNTPAITMIKSNEWNIIIELDSKQYEKIKDLKKVSLNLTKYNIETSADIETVESSGNHYGILSLNKYLANYVDDRYIDIELKLNEAKGLKIPNTAITSKDFYLVPNEFVTKGGNSSSDGLTTIVYDKNGEQSHEFVKASVYYVDKNNYAYIDCNRFEAGTVIAKTDSKEKYTLAEKGQLKGVYIVNQGFFDFRRIEVLYDNDEYSIVKEGTKYGLHVYDQVVSDADTAEDEAVVY